MKTSLALAAFLVTAAAPAVAQTAMPTAPLDTQTFRRMAMSSDAFEIASSRLAVERSRNARVRTFAQTMINDHAATSQALNGGQAVYGAGGEMLGGTVTGALAGAGIGALVGGPVGAAVGAGVGATAGAAAGGPGMMAAPPAQTGVPLDARGAAMMNQLAAATGPRFDRLYGQAQRQAHQEAVGLYTAYAQTGSDPSLRSYAQSVLPHLEQHYAAAQRLPR